MDLGVEDWEEGDRPMSQLGDSDCGASSSGFNFAAPKPKIQSGPSRQKFGHI